jgi:hypothetical protein
MAEAWLKTNRRALLLGMSLPAIVAAAGCIGLVWSIATGKHWALQLLFLVVTAAPMWMIGELLYAITRPRVGFENGELLVFLEPGRPTRVPIDIVEVFFLGQGPSLLPKLKGREPETQNLIIRLAESATDWKHRDVRPSFGQWCEGYITIRGSWCEPITPALMRRLNQRLAEIQRERRGDGEGERGREGEGERKSR